MYTIIETPTFTDEARGIWSEEERGSFCAWLTSHPDAGQVIPGSGGCRKVRWGAPGSGKRGGVRVIYFTRLAIGEIWLLLIYRKSGTDTIPAHLLKAIREVIENE